MIGDVLNWLSANWEPLVVIVGIATGVAGALFAFWWIKSRDPATRALEQATSAQIKTSEALLKTTEALKVMQDREIERNQSMIDLQNRYDGLHDSFKKLRSQYVDRCESMDRQLAGLTAQLVDYKRKNEAQLGRIEALETKVALLLDENKKLRALITEKEAELTRTRAERDGLQSQVDTLRESLDRLTGEVDRLKKRGTGPLAEIIGQDSAEPTNRVEAEPPAREG